MHADCCLILCLALVFTALLGNGNTALASPYQQYLDLEAGVEYDTNPQMLADDERSVWLAILNPGYRLQWKQDENELRAEAALRIERSSDTSLSVDREDPSLSLQWLRLNPRGETWLEGFYREQATRTTEFEDTGQLSPDATRTTMGLEAGWDHSLTERGQLGLVGRYDDVSYNGSDNFTDYELLYSALTCSYLWRDNTTPYMQLLASGYNPAGSLDESSEAYGFMLGLRFPVSPTLEMDLSGGQVLVEAENSDSNWNGTASLAYLGERTRWNISYSRATAASGSGGFTSADEVRAGVSYDYSELTTLNGDIGWRKNKADDLNESAFARLWALRKLTENWRLRFSWEFKQQKGKLQEDSQGQVVSVSVEYTLPYRT